MITLRQSGTLCANVARGSDGRLATQQHYSDPGTRPSLSSSLAHYSLLCAQFCGDSVIVSQFMEYLVNILAADCAIRLLLNIATCRG